MYKECNILLNDMAAIVDEAASLKSDDAHKVYLEKQLKDNRSQLGEKITANKESLQELLVKSRSNLVGIGAKAERIESGDKDYIAMLCIEHKKIVEDYIDVYEKLISLNKFGEFVKRKTQELIFLFLNGKPTVLNVVEPHEYNAEPVLNNIEPQEHEVELPLNNIDHQEHIELKPKMVVRSKWAELFTIEAVELLVELFNVVETASFSNDKTKILGLATSFKDTHDALDYIITKRRDYFYGYFYRFKNKIVDLKININRIDSEDADYIAMLCVENSQLINEYIKARQKHFEYKEALNKIRKVLSSLGDILSRHQPLNSPKLIQLKVELVEDLVGGGEVQEPNSLLCNYKARSLTRDEDVKEAVVPEFILEHSNPSPSVQKVQEVQEVSMKPKQVVQAEITPERPIIQTALNVVDGLLGIQKKLMKFTIGLRATLSKY